VLGRHWDITRCLFNSICAILANKELQFVRMYSDYSYIKYKKSCKGLLTPWGRILLENLIVIQQVKKYLPFMETEDFFLCSQEPTTSLFPEPDQPFLEVILIAVTDKQQLLLSN
jgi:hypothetical protein